MTDPVDQLLQELAARPSDVRLQGLEATLAGRIARRRRARATRHRLVPFQIATVSLSLLIGVTVGIVSSRGAATRSASLFESVARLAPSSLLEGR